MPQLIPSPDELASMRPDQRAKARRAIWAILADTHKYVDREARRRDRAISYGEAVREHARLLERVCPRDPAHVTAERRRLLLEAIQ